MYYDSKDASGYPLINNSIIILSDQTGQTEVCFYKYTFTRRFVSGEEIIDAAEWAEENCSGNWLIGINISGFQNKNDAVYFRLRWT